MTGGNGCCRPWRSSPDDPSFPAAADRRQRQSTAGLRKPLPFPEDLAVEVTINAIPRDGTPEPILQRAENLGRLWRLEMGQLLMHPDLMQFDAIGVFLTGSKISDVRLALGLLPAGERPLLFCGFNGVVLEKFMEGMCWRLGYDLICLNGLRDREALERMVSTTPFRRQRTVITGLQRSNAACIAARSSRSLPATGLCGAGGDACDTPRSRRDGAHPG